MSICFKSTSFLSFCLSPWREPWRRLLLCLRRPRKSAVVCFYVCAGRASLPSFAFMSAQVAQVCRRLLLRLRR